MTTLDLSQAALEVLQTPTSQTADVSQAALEVLQIPSAPDLRVSQVALEVISRNKNPKNRGSGGSAAANNAAITPALPTLAQVGDLLVVAVYGKQTGGSLSLSSGVTWTQAVNHVGSSGALGIWYRIYTGASPSSDELPTITPVGAAAGDTIIGQVGAWGDIDPDFPFVRALTVSQNASQQNIGPIAGDSASNAIAASNLLIVVGGKSATSTGVANLSNFAELGDIASALGNAATLVWDFQVPAIAGAIAAQTFIVSGGSANVGKGVQLVFQVARDTAVQVVDGNDRISATASTSSPAAHAQSAFTDATDAASATAHQTTHADASIADAADLVSATASGGGTSHADAAFSDADDAVSSTASAQQAAQPATPGGSGQIKRRRSGQFSIRGPSSSADGEASIAASFEAALDAPLLNAYAEVGAEERAATRRRAAIAALLP